MLRLSLPFRGAILFILIGSSQVQALPRDVLPRQTQPYTLQGCFTDAVGDRAFTGAARTAPDMTIESCSAFCSTFKYFGVEYGHECFCGNEQKATSVAAPIEECSMPCAGDNQEVCGNGNRLNVYVNNLYNMPVPVNVAGFPYVGCYTDSPVRTLTGKFTGADDMTVEKCASFCAAYAYFGVEYGRECFCGNVLAVGSGPAPETECTFKCPGAPSELCGAGFRLNLYGPADAPPPTSTSTSSSSTQSSVATSSPDVSGYVYEGCYSDSVGARGLKAKGYLSQTMTIEECATACAGYTYFGVEYRTECYCGVELASTSLQMPESDCSFACPGNTLQSCGAGYRLNLYKKPGSTPTTPEHPVTGFQYLSCWKDTVGVRSLPGKTYTSGDMTPQSCGAFCAGFEYFGVEYAVECFCGNTLLSTVAPESECSKFCSGDVNQFCGGSNRLNVYQVSTAPVETCSSSDAVLSALGSPAQSGEAADFCREFIGVPSVTATLVTVTPQATIFTTDIRGVTNTLSDSATITNTLTVFETLFETSIETTSISLTDTKFSTLTDTTTLPLTTSRTTTTITTFYNVISVTTTQTVTSVTTSVIVLARRNEVNRALQRDVSIPSYLAEYPASRISSACSCLSLSGNTFSATATAAPVTILSTISATETAFATVTKTITTVATSQSQLVKVVTDTASVTVIVTSIAVVTKTATVTDIQTIENTSIVITTIPSTTTASTKIVTTTKTITSTNCLRTLPVADPSFEQGSWGIGGSGNWANPIDASFAHSGQRFGRIHAPGGDGTMTIFQPLNICTSRNYMLTFYSRSSPIATGSNTASCTATFFLAGNIIFSDSIPPTYYWGSHFAVVYMPPFPGPPLLQIVVRCVASDVNYFYYIDDVVLSLLYP